MARKDDGSVDIIVAGGFGGTECKQSGSQIYNPLVDHNNCFSFRCWKSKK